MPDGHDFYGPPPTITDWRGEVWIRQFGEMYGNRLALRHRDDIQRQGHRQRSVWRDEAWA